VELAAPKHAAEQTCLAEALYFEARGEGEEGQKAIAEVILARVESKLYPKTICDVVYQGAERKTGCQFSFVCDGSLLRKKHRAAWDQAELLAAKIVNGSISLAGRTSKAVSFHTVGVNPVWSRTMMRVTQIGNHIFYRHMPKSMQPSRFASVEPVKVVFEQAGGILPEIQIAEEPALEPAATEVQVAAQPSGGA
jgi:spore germination cell wall hydrolase CwlJ-like protein